MREYLELNEQVLMDEGQVDAYVLASYRFIAGQEAREEDLAWNDLLEGREGLYGKTKRRGGEPEKRRQGKRKDREREEATR
jgi:hypothetical protein